MSDLSLLEPVLRCLSCDADLHYDEDAFVCDSCLARFPIVDGIPRFVPESYWHHSEDHETIQKKTKNYFGFEWEYFKEWGFIPDDAMPLGQEHLIFGGTVSARKSAFNSKCRMDEVDLAPGKIVLDAGCGNGRYTYEAGVRTSSLVIGVDIGYGSVLSARDNTGDLPNVIIVQADLCNLPFKSGAIDSCFSNGVLMHTGDAAHAFREVARTVSEEGVFVAHVYNKLNPIWEFNDWLLRSVTTRLSVAANFRVASVLAKLAAFVDKLGPKALGRVNYFLRLQSTVIHMYDWYAAPIATHHPLEEVCQWFSGCGFDILDTRGQKISFWNRPWACNVKGRKRRADSGNTMSG